MIALIASALLATNATAAAGALLPTNATPQELVAACRSMLPANVVLEGRIILRNRKGIPQAEHGYVLTRRGGATSLTVDGTDLPRPANPSESLLGTDVTWSDITLDYLWWDDVSCDAVREGETVHGQVCSVIVLRKREREGLRTVRAWVDRKTGALLQAEECRGENTLRRLWGTRIKKFGDRWMANVMEVETIGSGHRTKITVEELK